MTRTVAFVALAGAVTLTACDSVGQAMSSHTDVLARAGGHELTVDDGADCWRRTRTSRTARSGRRGRQSVGRLHSARDRGARDSTLAGLDLEPLLRPFMEQEVVYETARQT
jgi:hypothetical protein